MTTPSGRPLALTNSQYAAVVAAAEPLEPVDRPAFLAAVASYLRAEPTIGDGTIARAIRALQREFVRRLEVRPAVNHRPAVGGPLA